MKRARVLILAGVGLSIALTAIGAFSGEPLEGKSRLEDQFLPWLVSLAAILVFAGIMYAVSARVLSEGGKPGAAALAGAIVSVLSNAVFWLGVPSVLAGGAVAWATEARARGQSALSIAALLLCVLSVVGAIWLAFAG